MELLVVDPKKPEAKSIAKAARVIRKGGLVAFPTETVYGLGALGLDADAVARIYEAKGRPAWNPVIQHIANVKAAAQLVKKFTRTAEALADAFWPGPLTLVLPKSNKVPDIATAGLPAVAVRIPRHPVALALLQEVGAPIAAPSANRFTQVSPTTAKHVRDSLGDRVDIILDGGASAVGIESTVLDLTADVPTILRPGMITRDQIEAVLGTPVMVTSERLRTDDTLHSAARSPGMAIRHYAPHADVWLVRSSESAEIEEGFKRVAARKQHAAALVMTEAFARAVPMPPGTRLIDMPSEPTEYARVLYAALREADQSGAAVIVIEQPPLAPIWDAIRDRLTRAAAIP